MTTGLTAHDPPTVPRPEGGYVHAVEVGPGQRLLFISGQIPVGLDREVPPDAEAQCRLIWSHIVACLEHAGMAVTDLVKVTTFLGDRDVAAANAVVRREVLGEHRPALTVVVAEIYDSAWLLEIEAIAAAGGPS
ncbi:MAG: RidA family protein [Kineosporiaceae bacterium]